MTSYEPNRCSAYSDDLRWRIVWQCEGLEHSQKQVAQNLGIDKATVSRTCTLFHETGNITKKAYPKDKAFRMLTSPAQILILTLILNKPGIYLHEIQMELVDLLELEVNISTICRFLHANGCTRQKLSIVASQRDHALRQQYISDVSVYHPDMFIFLDETGADCRDKVRRYGYCLRGKPIKKQSLLVRGERTSAVALMSTRGILDVQLMEGTTNGDTFYQYILEYLLPHLQAFNGTNAHSVVVMDNCSIHHVEPIAEIIQDAGAILHYLPPYSPDFNPIEMAFSKVKHKIKDMEYSNFDTETIVLAAFSSITEQDCQGWISHSNIYN